MNLVGESVNTFAKLDSLVPAGSGRRRVELFDPALDVLHELVGDGAVDEAMVVADAHVRAWNG